MFTAALFTVVKTWKQPKCPSADKWIKKVYQYTVEYYSVKRKEILLFGTTWMDLEGNFISEISQTKTNTV